MFSLIATELLLCPGIAISNLDQNFNGNYQGYIDLDKKGKFLKVRGPQAMKALWVSQLWGDLHWEPLCNKQRELSFGKGHTWRASSQWRPDGYPSLGDTSTGNPYAWIISSGFAIKGKDSTGSPESCLACLLAHNVSSSFWWPLHLVSLLFYDSNICKERQKIW